MFQVREVSIYALIDPRTDGVRYVGQALDPTWRLQQHLYELPSGSKTHKNHWLRELHQAGYAPRLQILEVATEDTADDSERRWIAFYGREDRNAGPLTNHTDGGDGGRGQRVTEETRRKIGDFHRGKPKSATVRSKISASLKGRPFTDERRRNISASVVGKMRGRQLSDTHKAKVAEAQRLNRFICDICGRESNAGPLAMHQRASGHVGRTRV